MPVFTSEAEILKYAIYREEQAYKFYQDMAAQATKPALRQLFLKYAQEELGHQAQLEMEMLKLGYVVKEGLTIPSLDDTHDMIAITPEIHEDYKNILQVVIMKEKKAFRLYVDMALQTKNEELREMLLSLAEEEASHKARAEIELDEVSLKKND
jgi:rubrerythrin